MSTRSLQLQQRGNESPEYRTIKLTWALLTDLLSHSIQLIGDKLFAEGLIPTDVHDTVRGSTRPRQATRDLLTYLIDQIQINTSVYNKFISILKSLGPWTNSMVENMTTCYNTLMVTSSEAMQTNNGIFPDPTDKSYQSTTSDGEDVEPEQETEFPYLCLPPLSQNEKADLEQQLRSDAKSIKIRFSNFTTAIQDSLENRISLKEIKDSILSMQAFTNHIGIPVLDLQDSQIIVSAETLPRLFTILQKYISFFNYEVIEQLIFQYGTHDDKSQLQDYHTALNTFCQRNVYEIPPSTYSNPRPEAKEFVIKYKEHVAILQDVRSVKESVAKVLNLNCTALQLHTIQKGCVELHFFISFAVADHLFPISSSQHSALNEIGVKVATKQFCDGMPVPVPPVSESSNDIPNSFGPVRISKLWDTRNFQNPLKVHFMNTELLMQENWRVGQSSCPLTPKIVLAWARYWNAHSGNAHEIYYPLLDDKHASRDEAQIRVFFTSTEISRSRVGNDALKEVKDKPTMHLNLYGMLESEQRSLVLHEFGHALGLDHEHQRSDFWNKLRKFTIGEEKMKSGNNGQCAKAGEEHFKKEYTDEKGQICIPNKEESKYDPKSIMHYWFDINWLQPEYRDRQYVENQAEGILTDDESKVILGVHDRDYNNCLRSGLPEYPSKCDLEVLNTAYKNLLYTTGNKVVNAYPLRKGEYCCITMNQMHSDQQQTEEDLAFILEDAASGQMSPGKQWPLPQYKVLQVYIMNPDELRSVDLNELTIIQWANFWNTDTSMRGAMVPRFELESSASKANIRVLIQVGQQQGSVTVLGCGALNITDVSKPTMKLGLEIGMRDYNQHIVVHEFGHALGLQHEHQRSCFLNTAKKYLDENKMKKYLQITDAKFRRDYWASVQGVESHDYDYESVMHYWFSLGWLKDEYQRYYNLSEVEQLPDGEDKRVLRGIHRRQDLALMPSQDDFKFLKQCYETSTDHTHKSPEHHITEQGGMDFAVVDQPLPVVDQSPAESKLFLEYLSQIITAVNRIADDLKATNSSKRLQHIHSALLDFKLKVGFIGLTNSGKSTILNALLGQNFLPASAQRESVCPVCIQHDSHPDKPVELSGRIKSDNSLNSLAKGVEFIRTCISSLNKEDRERGDTQYDELVLSAPVLCLHDEKVTHFEFYDMPGVSEKEGSAATTKAKNTLEGSAAIVLVISPDSVDFKNLTDFIKQLKLVHPNIMKEQNRMLVLISKYDLCYDSEETLETYTWDPDVLREKVAKQISVPAKQVLCISAKSALKARIWKQNLSAVDKRTFRTSHALLFNTPMEDELESLEEFKPENVEKLANIYERFSRFEEFEKVLCKKLLSNDLVILLESTLDDCCCEINKMKAAVLEEIKNQRRKKNKLMRLIRQINDILKNHCDSIIDPSLENVRQNYEENLVANVLNLKSEITSEAATRMPLLRGQFNSKDELIQHLSMVYNEMVQFSTTCIKEQLEAGITEMRNKLEECSKHLLDRLKEDVTRAFLSEYLHIECIDLSKLIESFSAVQVEQPFASIEQFTSIQCEDMKSHVIAHTVTRQRNVPKLHRVSMGRKYGKFGPLQRKYVQISVAENYKTTVYEVNDEGFNEALRKLATDSANHVRDTLTNILEEQIDNLSKTLTTELQQLSEQPLQRLQKSELEGIVRGQDNSEKIVEYLENKYKELSNAIQEKLTQYGMGGTTDSGDVEMPQDNTFLEYQVGSNHHSLAPLIQLKTLGEIVDREVSPFPQGVDTIRRRSLSDTITFSGFQEIYEGLVGVSTKWFDLGIALEMDVNTLSAIDSAHHADVQICLREMLTKRLQSGGPLSWRVLCDCLKNPTVRRDDVAAKIEEEIGGHNRSLPFRKREHPDAQGSPPPTESKKPRPAD